MKRIRHTRLHFQEGNSDKVYEAELLQLSDTEYLVNFRYGKRGASLKEGTKTDKSVNFEAAAKVYKSLVVSKMNKGYELESGFDPLEQALSAPVAKASDPEKRPTSAHILARLALFAQPSPPVTRVSTKGENYIQGHSLSRTVWQAVQYGLPEVLEFLPGWIGTQNIPLNYSLLWALGKFGSAAHLPELTRLQKNLPPHLLYLADEIREQWQPLDSPRLAPEDRQAEFAEYQILLQNLSAYSRYETLTTRPLNQNSLGLAQKVLNWRGVEEAFLAHLQAAPVEQEWPDFVTALPAPLQEALAGDQACFADLRNAFNDLLKDWFHTLKTRAMPYYEQDKAMYAQVIAQVPVAELTDYTYYQDYLRRGQVAWLNADVRAELGNYINRHNLIPVDYPPSKDGHNLVRRLRTYADYDWVDSKPLSPEQREAAWQILEYYQCRQPVQTAMDNAPAKPELAYFRSKYWGFAEAHLSPKALSQYQGNLKPTVESLFYAFRHQKREALMENREAERVVFEAKILQLYRRARTDSDLHRAFLALIAEMELNKDTFRLMRKLFKLAEFRSDWELLARLYQHLESNPALSSNFYYGYRDAQHPLTPTTRNYFRRRVVRQLKTLAQHQPQAYVPLAVALLKQVKDGVACFEPHTETLSRYYETDDGYQRRTRKKEFPAFSGHLVLGYLLWQGSRLYQLDKRALKWLKSESFKTDLERPEAHATLWDQSPELVLDLLLAAQAEIVNDFALARLSSQMAFCEGLSFEMRFALLQRPYQNTSLFAAETLQAQLADPVVLAAFLASPFEAVRALALGQLSSAYLLGQPLLLVQLLCSVYPDLQAHLRGLEALFPALEANFSDTVIDYLLAQADTGRDLSALETSVTAFLRDSLQARVSLPALERLLASPQLFLQRLAVELLEASSHSYAELAHFPALMQASAYPAVQAGAIRLLQKLPLGVQMGQLPALAAALWHPEPAYRQAAAQILRGVLTQAVQTDYPGEIWQALYPSFFSSCSEEIRFEILALLEGFDSLFAILDPGQVWALLTARAKLAQQVGGRVISAQQGKDYGFEQLIRLSKNPSLAARTWALQALQNDPRSLDHFESLIEVLDNPWEDTRQAALGYFQGLDLSLWTPERVIAVCDQVYGDVQAFGQTLVSASFQRGQGPVYLQALSQHPSRGIQLFVSGFLESELAQQPSEILALEPFFRGVLLQVNRGRVLKDRVLRFLLSAALAHRETPQVADMVFELFSQQVLTTVQSDRAQLIATLHDLQHAYPDRAHPLQVIAPRKVAH